jgi:predicted MPP superfamily phosphohydrolase
MNRSSVFVLIFVVLINLYAYLEGHFLFRALAARTGKKIPPWIYWLCSLAGAGLYFVIRLSSRGLRSLFSLALSYWGLLLCVPFLLLADLLCLGRLMLRGFNGQKPPGRAGAAFVLAVRLAALVLGAGTIAHGLWTARHGVVTDYTLTTEKPLPPGGIRVILVSDIHIGAMAGKKQLARMAAEINALEGDLVILGGDLIDRDLRRYKDENLQEEMRLLGAPLGVYAVPGNHDYFGGSLPELTALLKEAGITMLTDEVVLAGGVLYLAGRNDYSARRWGAGRKNLEELTGGLDPALPLVVADHQPVNLQEAEQAGADLQVSGHTHNGQIWPGPLVTKGLYENSYGLLYKGKTAVIVSSGYGTWGPPLRIGTKAEIVRIELKNPPKTGSAE